MLDNLLDDLQDLIGLRDEFISNYGDVGSTHIDVEWKDEDRWKQEYVIVGLRRDTKA